MRREKAMNSQKTIDSPDGKSLSNPPKAAVSKGRLFPPRALRYDQPTPWSTPWLDLSMKGCRGTRSEGDFLTFFVRGISFPGFLPFEG
jgi:hypothetical protein